MEAITLAELSVGPLVTDGGCFSKVLQPADGGSLVGGPVVAGTWWAGGGGYVVNGGVTAEGAVSGPQGGYLVAVDLGEVVDHHQ